MKSEKRIILEKFSSSKHWINFYNKLWKNVLKKWTLKWRISKMKIMIEKRTLREIRVWLMKIKKTLLNIMSREKSRK